jgi:hypothetical protein
MLSPLRNRFGIPGVISVIALVFAMLGGAWAASNSGSDGKATASAKAKRGPRGPKGATGPAGPQGPVGANGKDGAAGANGAAGTNGKDGTSVTNTTVPTGNPAKCEERGGTEFKVGAGAPTFACNGEEGPEGPEGALGTAGTTLPQGATETGTWGVSGQVVVFKDGEDNTVGVGFHPYYAPISFPIPLAVAPPVSNAVYTATNPDPEHCSGSAANPTAAEGYVCVYEQESFHAVFAGFASPPSVPNVAGIVLNFNPTLEPGSVRAYGTWAVTGS